MTIPIHATWSAALACVLVLALLQIVREIGRGHPDLADRSSTLERALRRKRSGGVLLVAIGAATSELCTTSKTGEPHLLEIHEPAATVEQILVACRPCAVPIGSQDDGRQLWLDLCTARITTITGDPQAAAETFEALVDVLAVRAVNQRITLIEPDRADLARFEPHDAVRDAQRPIAIAIRDPDASELERLAASLASHPATVAVLALATTAPSDGCSIIAQPGSRRFVCSTLELTVTDGHDLPRVDPSIESAAVANSDLSEEDGDANGRGGLRVLLLGDVTLDAANTLQSPTALELVTYLACHRDGVGEWRVRTAMWPERATTTHTLTNHLWAARQALGKASDGQWWVPYARDGRYKLHPAVTTDLDDIEDSLRTFDADADADLERACMALSLVRGVPFDAPAGFEWTYREGLVVDAQAQIATLAIKTSATFARAGDTKRAVWATRQGLRGCPTDEALYRQWIEICGTTGDLMGVRRVVHMMCASLEVAQADELDPATVTLVRRFIGDPSQLRRRP